MNIRVFGRVFSIKIYEFSININHEITEPEDVALTKIGMQYIIYSLLSATFTLCWIPHSNCFSIRYVIVS
jgi:hypothetical protein